MRWPAAAWTGAAPAGRCWMCCPAPGRYAPRRGRSGAYQQRLPGYRLGDCSQALRGVRASKTGWELEQMRAAAEQVRTAAERVPSLLRVGVSEAMVQADVERVLRGAGHQGQLW